MDKIAPPRPWFYFEHHAVLTRLHPWLPTPRRCFSSDGVAQLTGNGVLAFTHEKYHLDELFTEDEMVFFKSNDDLVEKITRYLENEDGRRRIAKNGWEKAHRDLNERLAADFIVDVLFREELSHPYIWPTEQVI